jgi:addiction module HigA family antidote
MSSSAASRAADSATLERWRGGSFGCWTTPRGWRTWRQFQETGLRLWAATGRVNTASESTINGESALSGAKARRNRSRSSITISEVNMGTANRDRLPPIHPGEILREEFLTPLGMSAHELALALRVPATRINDIVNEKRGITADTALRLSRYFGTTSRFWMNMQASWELEVAEDQLGNALSREVLPRTAA